MSKRSHTNAVRHPTYRGQRISHAELISEAQQRLRSCGVPNHERAVSLSLLAKAVSESDELILCQQKPKQPKSPATQEWRKAYGLVVTWLKEHDLPFTLETVEVERPEISEIATFGQPFAELVRTGMAGIGSGVQERLQLLRLPSSATDSRTTFG
jgi:hypothetical protein